MREPFVSRIIALTRMVIPEVPGGRNHQNALPTMSNPISFRSGYRTYDNDHGSSLRSRGIDIFTQADKFDPQIIRVVQHFEKMAYDSPFGFTVPSFPSGAPLF
jgi:hypothetical protein